MLLCRQLELFGRELLAVDGTRIKAVNNKDRNFTRASLTQFIKAADAKLDDYLQRLDKSDATESATGGARANPGDVERLLLNTATQDGNRVRIGFGQDPVKPARARRSIWCARSAGSQRCRLRRAATSSRDLVRSARNAGRAM